MGRFLSIFWKNLKQDVLTNPAPDVAKATGQIFSRLVAAAIGVGIAFGVAALIAVIA